MLAYFAVISRYYFRTTQSDVLHLVLSWTSMIELLLIECANNYTKRCVVKNDAYLTTMMLFLNETVLNIQAEFGFTNFVHTHKGLVEQLNLTIVFVSLKARNQIEVDEDLKKNSSKLKFNKNAKYEAKVNENLVQCAG